MPNAPVAAVPAFQPNPESCAFCGKALGSVEAHVCGQCGMPQPIAGHDYFSIFGLNRTFKIDRADLQTRFYKISRVLHPDRFTTASAEARKLSLERMSFINEAYGTLKDPVALREYILEREGQKSGSAKKSQVPADLAESWFELQEALADDPSSAPQKLAGFRAELDAYTVRENKAISEIETEIETAWRGGGDAREALTRLDGLVQSLNYLRSMERDILNKMGARP